MEILVRRLDNMEKEEFNNEKALGFFGKSIVDKLEI